MSFAVYIMTNRRDGVLYTGMTDDLIKRAWQHRTHAIPGFTSKYNCEKLVWFEIHDSRESAFARERRIKKWKRVWKTGLIEQMNPTWTDLFEQIA